MKQKRDYMTYIGPEPSLFMMRFRRNTKTIHCLVDQCTWSRQYCRNTCKKCWKDGKFSGVKVKYPTRETMIGEEYVQEANEKFGDIIHRRKMITAEGNRIRSLEYRNTKHGRKIMSECMKRYYAKHKDELLEKAKLKRLMKKTSEADKCL